MNHEFIKSFKLWLQNKKYSPATVRNYLIDILRYQDFIDSQTELVSPFDQNILRQYLDSLSDNQNLNRYLSSLSQFINFALDQQLISQNPLKPLLKQLRQSTQSVKPDLNNLQNQFIKYLNQQNTTPSTIRNYVNDIKQYINWLDTQ